MGILRRNKRKSDQEEADRVEKEYKKTLSGWWSKVKESGQSWADDAHWRHVRAAQYKQLPYMMELCGAKSMDEMDWGHPGVRVLMLICDPLVIRDLQNPRRRQRIYDRMDDEM